VPAERADNHRWYRKNNQKRETTMNPRRAGLALTGLALGIGALALAGPAQAHATHQAGVIVHEAPAYPPGPTVEGAAAALPPGPTVDSVAAAFPPGPSIIAISEAFPPGPSIIAISAAYPPGPSIIAISAAYPPGPGIVGPDI